MRRSFGPGIYAALASMFIQVAAVQAQSFDVIPQSPTIDKARARKDIQVIRDHNNAVSRGQTIKPKQQAACEESFRDLEIYKEQLARMDGSFSFKAEREIYVRGPYNDIKKGGGCHIPVPEEQKPAKTGATTTKIPQHKP